MMEWGNELSLRLIDEYKRHAVLWDPKHEHYYSKNRKQAAWDAIAVTLNIDVGLVKQKMCSLLGSFRRERRRKLVRREGQDIYLSRWFAFERLQFLLEREEPQYIGVDDALVDSAMHDGSKDFPRLIEMDGIKTEPSSFVDEEEVYGEDSMTTQGPSADAHTVRSHNAQSRSMNKRRRTILRSEDTTTTTTSGRFVRRPNACAMLRDECSTYGQHVANKLRSYNRRTRSYVEHLINNVIFEADMGKYDTIPSFESNDSSGHSNAFVLSDFDGSRSVRVEASVAIPSPIVYNTTPSPNNPNNNPFPGSDDMTDLNMKDVSDSAASEDPPHGVTL